MAKNNFDLYQIGFQQGYRLASNIKANNSFQEIKIRVKVRDHINLLDNAYTTFRDLINAASESRIQFFDFMEKISDTALTTIMLDNFIIQVDNIFKSVQDKISSINNSIKDAVYIYELPTFKWVDVNNNSHMFIYEKNGSNSIENAMADFKTIQNAVRGLLITYREKESNTFNELVKNINNIAKESGLDPRKNTADDYLENSGIKENLENIFETLDSLDDYMTNNLNNIENHSKSINKYLEDLIDQYEDYIETSDEEGSNQSDDKPKETYQEVKDRKEREAFQQKLNSIPTESERRESFRDKYNQLVKPKGKSLSNKKYNISRIINRAIAQLGHDK